jgi:hypothetical protein
MAFSRDLTWVLMSFRVQDNGATFEDVTSSGNLRLIRNPELRRRLLVYTAAVRAFAQGVDDDGRDVIRSNLPPAFLDSPMFEELRWRVGNAGPDRLLPVAEILEVLRQDANATSEWLRRRQLHAAYVAGDLTWLLENRTWPMLADIRDERAGEPLGSWIGAIPN